MKKKNEKKFKRQFEKNKSCLKIKIRNSKSNKLEKR